MSISHYREFTNPVCDGCGHMLKSEKSDELARRAMEQDGWVRRGGKDLCRLCQKKEKKEDGT